MNTKNQQIEFEITPKDAKSNYSYLSNLKDDTRSETTSINVIFSHQSVIVIFICVIMSLIASFALGVEKGKLIAKDNVVVGTTAEQAATVPAALAINLPPEKTQTVGNIQPLIQQAQPLAPIVVAQEPVKITAGAPTGGFTIQVASVTGSTSAKGLADSLIKKGIAAFTKQSGKYTIVLAGNFAKKEDAQIRLKELKKTYADCFIRKI
ncbi:MAG: hypothetical protein AUJ74_02740 [Candidatus Omnitrophica bacterium CG1_02_44_16]|nr:MAG: hypothetical protein AUJ74_02740 [Candidatus Omnitrophica bacterium CG1_02_44_16]PIY83292.1 MAG: hypothetical protein COY78_02505 [Candidatus Omnitrophica bacterium CG_4_10_14_0_8_um_filter_44_12]PIZ84519.1 MAG: hypothetical protein COX96_03305 [Candidatus Omnitrophica bacterium CG_4_10_14_0_2_um_filter_44_9]